MSGPNIATEKLATLHTNQMILRFGAEFLVVLRNLEPPLPPEQNHLSQWSPFKLSDSATLTLNAKPYLRPLEGRQPWAMDLFTAQALHVPQSLYSEITTRP